MITSLARDAQSPSLGTGLYLDRECIYGVGKAARESELFAVRCCFEMACLCV